MCGTKERHEILSRSLDKETAEQVDNGYRLNRDHGNSSSVPFKVLLDAKQSTS